MNLTARKLSIIGMLGAVAIVLQLTPLGFIILPFSPVRATIMHIPVIIAAIVEGPVAGALVGLIFGGFSMYNAAVNPTSPISVIFLDPMVSILPRILIGITTHYAYVCVKKLISKKLNFRITAYLSSGTAAVVGTLTNTVGVLSMIFFRHLSQFAERLSQDLAQARAAIIGIGITQGVPEIIIAILIVIPVIQGVSRIYRK